MFKNNFENLKTPFMLPTKKNSTHKREGKEREEVWVGEFEKKEWRTKNILIRHLVSFGVTFIYEEPDPEDRSGGHK